MCSFRSSSRMDKEKIQLSVHFVGRLQLNEYKLPTRRNSHIQGENIRQKVEKFTLNKKWWL